MFLRSIDKTGKCCDNVKVSGTIIKTCTVKFGVECRQLNVENI